MSKYVHVLDFFVNGSGTTLQMAVFHTIVLYVSAL
uniref:Uncharacterized protein n=1 Tax=Anguilla anguilla TaxID=7936 RepID=A0A0E9VZ98_ANGAN